ncbi:cysteine peptidase family C39 domain-containing protein [Anaerolineales bacterium HSG6]|nr:cysteine peptidase family C39 domain-containing protein [Anaerolineales bacterium HSG6]MDM8530905.1 cysteine peptidase family C39 domain-containing protein [Anaerolineales bacterium HSG25]
MKKLKRIIQRDPTGCGIACISMLTGREYEEIKQEALKTLEFNGKKTLYTDFKDLKQLLKKYGVKTARRASKFISWEKLPALCVLAINYSERRDTWHWVLYINEKDDKYIFDPKKTTKTEKRRDFGRMRVYKYLTIKKLH